MAPMQLEVVDLADFDGAPTADLAAALRPSLTSLGFLYLKHTGLEEHAAHGFELARTFFEGPEAEKAKCAMVNNRGFMRHEVLDPTVSDVDAKEGFNLGVVAGEPLRGTHQLPQLFEDDVAFLANFRSKCFELCQRLLRAIAVALELEEDFFSKQHSDGVDSSSVLRFLRYNEVPAGKQVSANRAGAHSDYGSVTLLFVLDDKDGGGEGLQVLPPSAPVEEDQWQPVALEPGAVLVNLGDALEFWSGGQVVSTLHRVRLPTPTPAEGVRERFSIAWFNQPDQEAVLESVLPASEISEALFSRMARKGVRPGQTVTAEEHLQARLKATYTVVPAS